MNSKCKNVLKIFRAFQFFSEISQLYYIKKINWCQAKNLNKLADRNVKKMQKLNCFFIAKSAQFLHREFFMKLTYKIKVDENTIYFTINNQIEKQLEVKEFEFVNIKRKIQELCKKDN